MAKLSEHQRAVLVALSRRWRVYFDPIFQVAWQEPPDDGSRACRVRRSTLDALERRKLVARERRDGSKWLYALTDAGRATAPDAGGED